MSLETVLAALHHNPGDHLGWLAIADCLEEQGEGERAELARLSATLRTMKPSAKSKRVQDRVGELLAAGVKPCVPTITNSIGMVFTLIPPGKFKMRSPRRERDRSADEHQHEVEITKTFCMGIYAVTQEEYQKVMGENPAHFCAKGDGNNAVEGIDTARFPVETVSYGDALLFCKKLSSLAAEKKSGRLYRLPTEAEWEYACRGGAVFNQPFHFGASLSSTQANFDGDAEQGLWLGRPCEVGSYKPNAFGLYDMHGNVWEWCLDWYNEYHSKSSPRNDPAGPSKGSIRVLRGGCWRRLARRRLAAVGFRVALVPAAQPS